MKENNYKPIDSFTLFGWLEKRLRFGYLGSIGHLYRLLYLFFLGMLYIWNTHYRERTLYDISKLQPAVDSLRVKYMRLQSDYMLASTQSTVAQQAAHLGIHESKIPPYKIKSN